MMNVCRYFFLSVLFFAVALNAEAQFYTGSQMDFGKNRVQYDLPRDWKWYKFEKFDCYFYKNGKELAEYLCRVADKHVKEIEKLLDQQLDDKIQFIIYNKQSDFQQSNQGLITEETYNIGGVTRIVGSKVSIYFDGDHQKFEQQIRMGIAEVLINQMLYGGNVKDMLKNSTFLNLPEWYTKGLISYAGQKWSTEIDDQVRDGIVSKKYFKINRLTGQDAIYAGHSIWNYIAETYGESVIPNILYMSKTTRSVESACLFVLGASVRNLTYDWQKYYEEKFEFTEKSAVKTTGKLLLQKPKSTRVYHHPKLSPNGKSIAYVTNEFSQNKVWIYNTETGKHKRIMKRGAKLQRINDFSYPLLAWHPSGKILAIVVEEKGEMRMYYYDVEEKKKDMIKLPNFEKVLDMSYSHDGKKIVMSAVNNGISDIYVFNIAGSGLEKITNDVYDDFNPRFINNSQKIIFSSNRPYDSLKTDFNLANKGLKSKDIFIYNYTTQSKLLKRVTTTLGVDELMPMQYDSTHVTYLSDENGIQNRYMASFDSVIAYVDTTEHYRYITQTAPITNCNRNILEHDVNSKAGKIVQVVKEKNKYYMYLLEQTPSAAVIPLQLKDTYYRIIQNKIIQKQLKSDSTGSSMNTTKTIKVVLNPEKNPKRDTTGGIDINNYSFEPNVTDKENKPKKEEKPQELVVNTTVSDTVKTKKTSEFVLPIMRNYYVFYNTDYVVSQVDNSFLNATYQRFNGATSPVYPMPGFTGLFKIGMSDLFEDHRIVGGFRLAGDLNANEYFLSFENRKKRWDRQVVLHRQALLDIFQGSSLVKIHVQDIKYALKYPINEVQSLRFSLTGRYDRTVFLATDQFNLPKKNRFDYLASAKVEYVFDNTISRGLNLYKGLRMKFFAEHYRIAEQVDSMANVSSIGDFYFKPHDMTVLGLDIRHYTKVFRDIIWANRLSASTSFGEQKLIYYMGGVDNWLAPRFDLNTPVSTKENYGYQTLATPMRGFWQNIRNGNSFVLFNSELRVPIFRLLSNKPVGSDFFYNFQVIGFADVGTAWNGKSPKSDENALNTYIIGAPGNPITVILKNRHDPLVGGYGFGLRSRLLGYFIRADWAWGVQDGRVVLKDNNPENKGKPSMFYLSLSLDF